MAVTIRLGIRIKASPRIDMSVIKFGKLQPFPDSYAPFSKRMTKYDASFM